MRRRVHASYDGAWAVTVFCAALLGCGDEATTLTPVSALEVHLEVPEGPDPFEGMVSLRLEASSPDFPEIVEKVVQRGSPVIELPELRYGKAWVLTVEGYDAQNKLIAQGRSASFDLSAESPQEVRLPLISLERFTLAVGKLTVPRYGHSASRLPDGRVLVAGGFTTNGEPTASVEIYEPISGTFESMPPLSQPRGGHHAFLRNQNLVLVGGRDVSGLAGSVEIYVWGDGSSEEVVLTTPREEAFVAQLSDGTILVAGGLDAKAKIVESTELVDPVNATRSDGPTGGPAQHGGYAFTLADGRVVAAGGWTGPPVGLSKRSWVYQASAWSDGPPLEEGSEGAQVVVMASEQVIIAGGNEQDIQLFSEDEFFSAGRTTENFREHAMVALGARVLIAGGAGGPNVEIWQDGALQPAGELVRARRQFTLTALTDGRALAIGGRVAGAATDETEIFTPRP